ncbi:uncharacterized protein [Parasteatoda tepidariorum]|uniref:uncharacterized protein n=1 Tax=Parasteatoda tepidariorum TaxID=114398 RepID=UPI001C71AC7A|nr:uncharacterized protein LOC107446783 [Parasteatoda tepidariorum]
MASERCDLLREGFLDVKFPPDSPERVLHKAWRKLWIRAFVLQPLKREPSLILNVTRNAEDKQSQSLKVSRDGLLLFRCRSGSRPLQTWALSSGTSLIVYLAAENEEETQSWMKTIRDGLWPTIQNMSEKSHDVSLIDDEKTFSTGILGLYGRLVKTPDGMTSIIHPHWQGILLRWKQEDVVNIKLVRKVGGESSGVFKITLKSSKTETRTFYFYSNTATSAIDWLQSSAKDSTELSTNSKSKNTKELSRNNETQNDIIVNGNDTPQYATIRKASKQLENEQGSKLDSVNDESTNKTLNDKRNTSNFLSTNISSDLLDASLSFVKLPLAKSKSLNDQLKPTAKSDEDSDETSDMYEHVYEDMVPKSSRSDTVYEDVLNSESEYVPPLPPPLPTEKPQILRLLKLSESVAEALKLAEEQHVPVVHKNSKRLLDSPVRETVPQIFQKKPILRRSSEPNII